MRFSHLVVAAGLSAISLAAHADLVGDTINVSAAYPTTAAVTTNLGDFTVPSGFNNYPTAPAQALLTFALFPTQILITADQSVAQTPSAFYGLEFTDLTNSDIASATIDPSSTFPGPVVSLENSNEVLVNFASLAVTNGDALVIDLTFTPPAAATPEPSSIALLGTGVLGVAGTMRRRWSRS